MIRFLPLLVLLGSTLASSALAAKKTPAQAPAAVQAAPPAAEAATDAPGDGSAEEPGATSSAKITGIYSTLKSVGGDDDMIGLEVVIVRSREGLRAFVQTADGVPAAPVIVPVSVDGPTVSFNIPSTTGEPLEFRGKATRQGLSGTLDDRPLTIPRRRSYWQ
jgi:hypothetical protein